VSRHFEKKRREKTTPFGVSLERKRKDYTFWRQLEKEKKRLHLLATE